MNAIDELSHLTRIHFTDDARTRKRKATLCDQVRAAREQFFAQHGRDAELASRRPTPREIRKALVNAEMALWECF